MGNEFPNISYSVKDDYLVIRINRRNALKTKIRGYRKEIEQVLSEVLPEERPLASVAVALALFRCRDVKRYITLIRRAFFDPRMKKLVFAVAEYYVNMHTVFQNLDSKMATIMRYVLTSILV